MTTSCPSHPDQLAPGCEYGEARAVVCSSPAPAPPHRVTPRCPALHYQDTAIAAQCPVAATSPHLHSYEHAHHIPGYGLLRDYMQLLFNYLHTILIKNWFPVVTL